MYCNKFYIHDNLSLSSGSWSSPSVKGSRPPPCAYFSLTMIDEEHAVMFGGLSVDVYVLHLPTMVSGLLLCTYYIDSLSLSSSAGCKMLFHIQDNEHRSL